MNKLTQIQNQPDISINSDVIADIKKLFSENWSALLTKNEQTIVKILHNEKSALNIYEIRRILIFSTFCNIMKEFITIHDNTRNKMFDNVNNQKKFFKPQKEQSGVYMYNVVTLINSPDTFVLVRFINELKLSQYEKYPCFEYPIISVREFGNVLSNLLTEFQPTSTKLTELQKQISKNGLLDNLNLKLDYILSNKTNAEEFIIKVLSSLKIEIFGFSTISSILENLHRLRIVLMRVVNIGKSKTAYFINPILINKTN